MKIGQSQPLPDKTLGLESAEAHSALMRQFEDTQARWMALPADASLQVRAQIQLELATALLGLGRHTEAWDTARLTFEPLIEVEAWEEAALACEVLYQAEQAESIRALAHGVWLAVTYPVPAGLTVNLLHHIVDETPDNSDGGAVAAVAAQYIVELRAQGSEDLAFITAQVVAQVAKRHRQLEDPQTIAIWIEILELNDVDKLFERLARMLDVMAEGHWWIDRDALRARLPV